MLQLLILVKPAVRLLSSLLVLLSLALVITVLTPLLLASSLPIVDMMFCDACSLSTFSSPSPSPLLSFLLCSGEMVTLMLGRPRLWRIFLKHTWFPYLHWHLFPICKTVSLLLTGSNGLLSFREVRILLDLLCVAWWNMWLSGLNLPNRNYKTFDDYWNQWMGQLYGSYAYALLSRKDKKNKN